MVVLCGIAYVPVAKVMAGVGMFPNAIGPWHPNSVTSDAVAPRDASSTKSFRLFFTLSPPKDVPTAERGNKCQDLSSPRRRPERKQNSRCIHTILERHILIARKVAQRHAHFIATNRMGRTVQRQVAIAVRKCCFERRLIECPCTPTDILLRSIIHLVGKADDPWSRQRITCCQAFAPIDRLQFSTGVHSHGIGYSRPSSRKTSLAASR